MPLAYQFQPGGGISTLEAVTRPRAELGPNEVRVAVRAVSLNFREILIAKGLYPAPTDRPVVPCSDGAGEVLEAGPAAAAHFAAGDRVAGAFFHRWLDGPATAEKVAVSGGCNVDGWLAEEVVLDASALVPIPAGVSFTTAACAPCAGVTAWVSMFEVARLKAGSTLVVQGTGGVAMWAAKLAAAAGIDPFIVTSDPTKAAKIHPAGARRISYIETPRWADRVLHETRGRGADLVIELGGKTTIGESLRSLAFGGHIAAIGGLGGWTYDAVEPLALITKCATLHGIFVGSTASLRDLLAFVAAHRIEPHVSHTYSFSEAPAAIATLESGLHTGKIVVAVS